MKNLLLVIALMGTLGVFAGTASATILIDFTREAGYANRTPSPGDGVTDGTAGLWAFYHLNETRDGNPHPNPADAGWRSAKDVRGGTHDLGDGITLTESSNGGWWIGDNGSFAPPTPAETGVPIPLATSRIGRHFAKGESVTLTIDGLDANQLYSVTAFASAFEPVYGGIFNGGALTLDSLIIDTRPDQTTPGDIGTFNVTTDGNGQLVISADAQSADHYVLVNGLILEVIPEPSTLGLLGLGSLMFIRRRTR